MCGIIGAITTHARRAEIEVRLPEALAALAHRGPDGHGTKILDHAVLGHARLAIIDLTSAAAQPMALGPRFTIVFNGEIYNYRELYAEFLSSEPDVNPRSDTSVLLGMFRRFGEDMLPHLNGMFAIAIFDSHKRRLFLARDRFGEKPLYFASTREGLYFGSETRAIRVLSESGGMSLDPTAAALYLHLGSVPSPHTIFKGITSLPAAHYMYVGCDAPLVCEPQRYWRIGQTADKNLCATISLENAREKTHALMVDALRTRMVSDVPVGLFLSGGLDSGALASLANDGAPSDLRAIVVDFAEKSFSEGEMAHETAREFGISMLRTEIRPSHFLDSLDRFFRVSDQPTSDGFNTYVVSQAAHEAGGKVWLSGVGGDELFGGYPFFGRITPLRYLSRMMRVWPGPALFRTLATRGRLPIRIQRAATLASGGPPYVREYQVARAPLPFDEVRKLAPQLTAGLRADFADALIADAVGGDDDFQVASSLETRMYMGNQLLRDMDNFSMANSIELRAPFLDHNLFDFVFSLPSAIKRSGTTKKPLMVSSLRRALPPTIARAPKRGFTFPLEIWIREKFAASFLAVATDSRLSSILDPQAIEQLWKEYKEGRAHWSVVWNVYALGRWIIEHEHY